MNLCCADRDGQTDVSYTQHRAFNSGSMTFSISVFTRFLWCHVCLWLFWLGSFKMWSFPPVSHFFRECVLLSLLLVCVDSKDSVSTPVVENRLAINMYIS